MVSAVQGVQRRAGVPAAAEVGRELIRVQVSPPETESTVRVNVAEEFRAPGQLQRKIGFGRFEAEPHPLSAMRLFELDLKPVRVR